MIGTTNDVTANAAMPRSSVRFLRLCRASAVSNVSAITIAVPIRACADSDQLSPATI